MDKGNRELTSLNYFGIEQLSLFNQIHLYQHLNDALENDHERCEAGLTHDGGFELEDASAKLKFC